MALAVVVGLLVIVHVLSQRVRRYEKELVSFFDSTNDCGLAFVCGDANYLVSSASRVARESFADSASGNDHFDVGEKQVIIRHFLKEVRDCKFIVAIPYFLPDDIDNSQSRLFPLDLVRSLV